MLKVIKEYHSTKGKDAWGQGEWVTEPDKIQMIHEETGLDSLIVRHPSSGHLCGYVGIAKGHPFYELRYDHKVHVKNLDDIRTDKISPINLLMAALDTTTPLGLVEICVALNVHGGLSFSDHCQPGAEDDSVCHIVLDGRPDNIWWLGFDCAHAGDLTPSSIAFHKKFVTEHPEFNDVPEDIYRNIAYVKSEIELLALQLSKTASLVLTEKSIPAN